MHHGMWLSMGPDKLVHLLGHALSEPSWWKEFTETHKFDGHHGYGDRCLACVDEMNQRWHGDW